MMGANYIALLSLILLSVSWKQVACVPSYDQFLQCMQGSGVSQTNLVAPNSPTFPNLFENAQQNTRWLNLTNTPRPVLIFTPSNESDIQAAIVCSKKSGLIIRIKSGGHDYENLSFLAAEPYIIVDLVNLRRINFNMTEETAWVQTGVTLGELYVKISQTSPVHAFPGGTCPSVGTGGFISGGGFGMLVRKYGLGADNVLDAHVIDANGKLLDRASMGEDFFWAIRGGGGGSFGVVTAWKIKLVRVPPLVTFFHKSLYATQANLTQILSKWQAIMPTFPPELLMRVFIRYDTNNHTMKVGFNTQYLGPKKDLVPLLTKIFPELNVTEQSVYDYPWINATLAVAGKSPVAPLEELLVRVDPGKTNLKGKSDFVYQPIPEAGIQGMLDRLNTPEHDLLLIFEPYGGKLNEIPEGELPFPHRNGTLFNIQYMQKWLVNNESEIARNFKHVNEIYDYMGEFVSKNPRACYVNYKDLDIGSNPPTGNAKYSEARVWGEKYFKGNFLRLSQVKTKVDPENFFRYQQSIPLMD